MINFKVVVIGITGPTRCGKTTLANSLSNQLGSLIISQDKQFENTKAFESWETIKSIDMSDLRSDISGTIMKSAVEGRKQLIIEGFLLFDDEWIFGKCDKRIWINISEEIMIKRRLATTPTKEDQIAKQIIPAQNDYQKRRFDTSKFFVIDGSKSKEDVLKLAMSILV